MNTKRQVKCGYCGEKRALWSVVGITAHRLMRRLPNGLECCPACYPARGQERAAWERERDAERRARAERRANRMLKRAIMPYAVKRAA